LDDDELEAINATGHQTEGAATTTNAGDATAKEGGGEKKSVRMSMPGNAGEDGLAHMQ
jgi:hypothetical protein